MTAFSPATQAVLDAFRSSHTGQGCLAAALRAAADQVPYLPKNCSSYDINVQDGREEVRSFLLTIATELEAQ